MNTHSPTAPGTQAPGTLAPGTPAPGTQAPGTLAPGTPAPGTPAPRHPAPGTLSAWHLVTGEYPPARGGVSDYTFAIASGLARAGDEVNVWCPGPPGGSDAAALKGCTSEPAALKGCTTTTGSTTPGSSRVKVHAIAGSWTASDLKRLDSALDAIPHPKRLLVQWVPHAFGQKSINVRFCRWIRSRARRGDVLDLMIHEPGLGFGEGSLTHNAAAAVHRLMLTLLLSHARRVWIAIPAWGDTLRRFALGRGDLEFRWLPIPSTIPVERSTGAAAQLRKKTLSRSDGLVVGHFSTYPADVRRALCAILPGLLAALPEVQVQLLGRGSEAAAGELRSAAGAQGTRIEASGELDASTLSSHLQICDVMLQPYSDGASTRRTTLMAALAHGLPAVTTLGRLSEDFWRVTGAVSVSPAGDTVAMSAALSALLCDPARRREMATAARETYEQRFSLPHVIETLRRDAREIGCS